jgi:hypothetical protein
MNTRPAWGVLFVGMLGVLALLVSPIWLEELEPYFRESQQTSIFPAAFDNLPPETQDIFLEMYASSEQMAIDFVAARLQERETVEDPPLPSLDPNPTAVERLLTGNFVTVDPVRSAEGTATLYRLSDGRRIVRLEGLDALNGPDLRLLLSAYPTPTTQEELEQVAQLQIDLGPLKATQGDQNYEITDPSFNSDNYTNGSVVIYSARYDVVFSFAPLAAPEAVPGT